jgi:hypothetical protein
MSMLGSTTSAKIALPDERLSSRHLAKVDKPVAAIPY